MMDPASKQSLPSRRKAISQCRYRDSLATEGRLLYTDQASERHGYPAGGAEKCEVGGVVNERDPKLSDLRLRVGEPIGNGEDYIIVHNDGTKQPTGRPHQLATVGQAKYIALAIEACKIAQSNS